jgi:hypothetical protein
MIKRNPKKISIIIRKQVINNLIMINRLITLIRGKIIKTPKITKVNKTKNKNKEKKKTLINKITNSIYLHKQQSPVNNFTHLHK